MAVTSYRVEHLISLYERDGVTRVLYPDGAANAGKPIVNLLYNDGTKPFGSSIAYGANAFLTASHVLDNVVYLG
jgi:hypothetical protein